MPELDRAVEDRIAAYRPERVPPFAAVEDARRRRRVRTGAAAGLAALAVAAVVAVPAVLRDPAPAAVPAAAPAAPSMALPRPEPTPVPAAEPAQQRWRERGARSYTIKVTLLCFCSPTPPRTVVVRDGRTVGAGPSVADLFATIGSGRFDKVTATYDPTYGFPTRVVVDPDLSAVDEERTWVVTDYRPSR